MSSLTYTFLMTLGYYDIEAFSKKTPYISVYFVL
jgi:hypothetical protein